jgi:hypothetical protein
VVAMGRRGDGERFMMVLLLPMVVEEEEGVG